MDINDLLLETGDRALRVRSVAVASLSSLSRCAAWVSVRVERELLMAAVPDEGVVPVGASAGEWRVQVYEDALPPGRSPAALKLVDSQRARHLLSLWPDDEDLPF